MFASAWIRNFGKGGSQPGVCWLIACRTVSYVVHDQKPEFSGRTVVNRRKQAEAGENRDVAVDRYNMFFLGRRQALPGRRAKPRRSEHVEIARLVERGVKPWRWRTNIANDQAILEEWCQRFQKFATVHFAFFQNRAAINTATGFLHMNELLEDSVVPVGLLDVAQAVPRHMQLFEQRLDMNAHLNLARYFFSDVVPVADDHERRNPIDRDGARW